MSFTSLWYLVFFAALVVLYYLLPGKWQKSLLLCASLFFFVLFGKKSFLLMLGSVTIAYAGGRMIGAAKELTKKRLLLALTLISELAILIGLKYATVLREHLHLFIPIGISFYTLAIMGYCIDVYRGKYEAEKNYADFLLFASFFPHILQGPIARYDALAGQFREIKRASYEGILSGCQLMLWGYIKKMVIADRAAIFVNAVYGDVYTQGGTVLFLASLLYTVQIYMDFSGCVDIALGSAEILGIRLQPNFRQPYLASSINDFWRRWHISLSTWFRDYLYIPLGGNRKGTARRWLNVLIVFAVSGFWHGVGINFVIWGLLHGMYQVIGAVLKPLRERSAALLHMNKERKTYRAMQVIFTFLLVNFAWIFFRITDVGEALFVVKEVFTNWSLWVFTDGSLLEFELTNAQWLVLLSFLVITFMVDLFHEKRIRIRDKIRSQHLIVRWTVYLGALFAVLLWGAYGNGYNAANFIYMNF